MKTVSTYERGMRNEAFWHGRKRAWQARRNALAGGGFMRLGYETLRDRLCAAALEVYRRIERCEREGRGGSIVPLEELEEWYDALSDASGRIAEGGGADGRRP